MSCLQPIQAYQPIKGGKLQFSKNGTLTKPIKIPCGNCIACRSDHAMMWATRAMHEASLHENNHFLTITYDEENLPEDRSLNHKHFQNFMKKLRNNYPNIRFLMCGEYGEQTYRPHYHAIIYNLNIDDLEHYSGGKYKLYKSEKIQKIWGKGDIRIGTVTRDSCLYVVNYINKEHKPLEKKIYTQRDIELKKNRQSEIIDPGTGELITVKRPYIQMSTRPGIGYAWYEKYKDDCYPKDFITTNGKKRVIPKYYDRKLKQEDESLHDKIKENRIAKSKSETSKYNNTPERLQVRGKCLLHKLKENERNKV